MPANWIKKSIEIWANTRADPFVPYVEMSSLLAYYIRIPVQWNVGQYVSNFDGPLQVKE